MAEWLYEAGIGEARAALVADGRIVEARIERDDEGPRVGAVVAAKLIEAGRGGKGALVALDWPGDPPATLVGLPSGTSTGASLVVQITRMALSERGRDKPARARIAPPDAEPVDGPDLHARLAASGVSVPMLHPTGADRLEEAGWSEIIDCVREGHWPFAGGALWVDATPAMVLIDIDCEGDPLTLRAPARHGLAQAPGVPRDDESGLTQSHAPARGSCHRARQRRRRRSPLRPSRPAAGSP